MEKSIRCHIEPCIVFKTRTRKNMLKQVEQNANSPYIMLTTLNNVNISTGSTIPNYKSTTASSNLDSNNCKRYKYNIFNGKLPEFPLQY
uniref:Uncharacterized protein n=1 Tax=Manihot esculenta TaxID=3983 RepID=A0A2C9W7J3_MANES